ncbi:MAG: rhomboid family intramembrane serine protease [Pseudomonadales bacterium]|jgi:membrane associated rhomboid family serine protease|nr:rhomboid family intramembrane serine protease [Pseudomonadales bacterium]
MFPLYDDNVRLRWPLGTVLIIALNVFVWFFVQGFGAERALARSLCLHGLIPADLLGLVPAGFQVPLSPRLACVVDGDGNWFNLLSSMFMHGGWFHIIGNMWFLWVFGDNVEDVMGTPRYVLFYLLSGLAAAGAQVATDPSSTVPMVGASGAIGGVLGAYARMYPRAHVHTLIFLGLYVTTIAVPAMFMLGYWFLVQLLSGTLGDGGPGVAFWAHAGGFAAGLVLSLLLVSPRSLAAHRSAQRRDLQSRYRWF